MKRKIIDYAKLERKLPALRKKYQNAQPFPHIVIEELIDPTLAKELEKRFPSPKSVEWLTLKHVNEEKLATNDRKIIPKLYLDVIEELNSERFVAFLSKLTGIKGMFPDEELEGGGLHQIERGGYLNIHADFTVHPHHRLWKRRVNVLLYLNSDWKDSYNGHLELWDKKMKHCEKKVAPTLNRCVIFNTDFDSFHGHPEVLKCPGGRTRKSIALYYFTKESKRPMIQSTEYRSRPGEGKVKSTLIYLDKLALRGYDRAKRLFGISDKTTSRILRKISRKKR